MRRLLGCGTLSVTLAPVATVSASASSTALALEGQAGKVRGLAMSMTTHVEAHRFMRPATRRVIESWARALDSVADELSRLAGSDGPIDTEEAGEVNRLGKRLAAGLGILTVTAAGGFIANVGSSVAEDLGLTDAITQQIEEVFVGADDLDEVLAHSAAAGDTTTEPPTSASESQDVDPRSGEGSSSAAHDDETDANEWLLDSVERELVAHLRSLDTESRAEYADDPDSVFEVQDDGDDQIQIYDTISGESFVFSRDGTSADVDTVTDAAIAIARRVLRDSLA